MQIVDVRAHVLEAPLSQPFSYSRAWYATRTSLIVEITTDAGADIGIRPDGASDPAGSPHDSDRTYERACRRPAGRVHGRSALRLLLSN
jgi:hypothetical protein